MDNGKPLKYILDEAEASEESMISFFRDYFVIKINSNSSYKINDLPTERCYELAIKRRYVKENIEILKRLQHEVDDPEFNLKAVTKSGLFLEYVKNQTPLICLAAIKQNNGSFDKVKIVDFELGNYHDCLKKLQNKLKLETLIKD